MADWNVAAAGTKGFAWPGSKTRRSLTLSVMLEAAQGYSVIGRNDF